MTDNTVLLCLQLLPEEVQFYKVVPTEAEIRILKKAHGKFINADKLTKAEADAVLYVLAATSEHKDGWDGVPKAAIGKWVKNRLNTDRPRYVSGRFIITGMFV